MVDKVFNLGFDPTRDLTNYTTNFLVYGFPLMQVIIRDWEFVTPSNQTAIRNYLTSKGYTEI